MSAQELAVFDISQFEVAEVGVLDVLNVKDEPMLYNGSPVRIHLYGPGSAQFVRAQAKADTAAQQRTFAALRGKVSKTAVEDQREDLITKLVACTAQIENFPVPGGAEALYRNAKLGYITNQVIKYLDDWANFQQPSSKN
jgi:hypothetical protein